MSAINTFGMEGIQARVQKFTPALEDRFIEVVKHAIEASYQSHGMRQRTQDEDNRRLNLCTSIMMQAMEVNAPLSRVLDTLPGALGVILDGGTLELSDDGGMWQVHGSGLTTPLSDEFLDEAPDLNEEEIEFSEDDLHEALLDNETAEETT